MGKGVALGSRRMRGGVVFCEESCAVVCGEDEDGIHGEEGHIRCHNGRSEVEWSRDGFNTLSLRLSGILTEARSEQVEF